MRFAATLLVLALSGCGGSDDIASSAQAPSDQAVAFQSDAAHTGVSGIVAPAFPASQAWSRTFVGNLSYPLVAGGKVFVVEQPDASASGVAKLHALTTATGALAWGPVVVSSSRQTAAPAFDQGKVFVATFAGEVRSYDAATGQPGWSVKLTNSYGFVTAPTASAGIVYVGDGGTSRVVALDASTGAVLWNSLVNGGGSSIPSVAQGGVIVAYPCQYYAFNALTGAERWHYSGPCTGGGGATVPISQGTAYVRDSDIGATFGPLIDLRDAMTGASRGRYLPTGLLSQVPIPAVTSAAAFLLEGATLRRFDATLARAAWSFAGDGTLTTPPIVADTAILVAGTSGMLYAVDATSGSQRWSAQLPSTMDPGNDTFTSVPSGLAAGEGHLIAPARNTLTAFRLTP